ncbi:MAG: ATP synthase F1 subunit gamma [Puniceicoccales bacterium]|jgi:F-type H+-transporting ATPase subunit gamma|nr:ATP synthase F1 subunit gamma [Puniceicoccales bacterium]
MPKGLREISSRIKSVKSTAQITKAMQLVASSKMKRAQDTALNGRDYTRLLADILDSAQGGDGAGSAHPFAAVRETHVRGVLLVTTDKGLCGALNANLFRIAAALPANTCFVSVGRKGAQYLTRSGRTLLADFPVSDRVNFSETRKPAEYLIAQFLAGKVDTVEVVYARFKNTLVQEAVIEPLLPTTDVAALVATARARLGGSAAVAHDTREMHFEPSAGEILRELPALFVKHAVYHAVLEAKASEHSARMVAMKAATDNADKITGELTLEFNKARQAAITQEINEITAAALAA